MARRKNTRRFDPRYFMDEKTDIITEAGKPLPDIPDQEKYDTAIDKIRDLVEVAFVAARNSPRTQDDFVDFIDSLHDTYGSGAI